MKETFYFSHDYHARDDEKIVKLIAKHGWEAYGIFWAIIEKLYESGGILERDYDNLAFALRTDSERIANVIESGLFEVKHEKFYSKSVNARLIKRKGKSELARQSANLRWSKPKTKDANAMRTQCDGNAIKESKVKESKVNIVETSSTEPFSFNEYLNKLKSDKDNRFHIIACYWEFKGIEYDNLALTRSEVKRNLKPASALKFTPLEKIQEIMFAFNGAEWMDWTLETVIKYVGRDLTKLNK